MRGAIVGESTLTEKRLGVLVHLHSIGKTLEQCSDRKLLGLSERTLERYARRAGLVFPDYCPRAMKPRKVEDAPR